MPSFDIVSEVDHQEVDNAINQANKEIATRFDFKGANVSIELEKDAIKLRADNGPRLHALHEIVIGKLARRNVPLVNVERGDVEISSTGQARQELKIKRGIDHEKGKAINAAIKATKLKVTSQMMEAKVRVTGKNRDDLQAVIAALRGQDFGLALAFDNFRN
jgi:uncharacterized protein YajQ (UPF0234 family)